MKIILFFLTIVNCTVFAQISITNSDLSNFFAVGISNTIYEYDTTAIINIGSTGGGNNWDFSGLQSNFNFNYESVDPATTPYLGELPGAEIATYSIGEYGGEQAAIWSYSTLNNSTFKNLGSAIVMNSQPGVDIIIRHNPARIEVELPMTFNSSWIQTYSQTIFFNGVQFSQSSVNIDITVDAYGTMTLPGGASEDALRQRVTVIVNGITSVTYTFVSESGAKVDLHASDTNPPTSGDINVDEYNWNLSPITSVEQISELPFNYNLSQNYPNPFNPSTNIQFSLPQSSFVTLEIFNTLSEKISMLVSEELSAGTYNYDWNGTGLTSGIYFYKLQAGSFAETKKMVLLK